MCCRRCRCVGGGAGVLEEVQVCWRRCRCVVGGAGVLEEVQMCWRRCRWVGVDTGALQYRFPGHHLLNLFKLSASIIPKDIKMVLPFFLLSTIVVVGITVGLLGMATPSKDIGEHHQHHTYLH